MKVNELKKLIQEIVRKEVRAALKDELKDVKFLVEVLTEAKSTIKPNVQKFEKYEEPSKKVQPKRDFGVKDNVINDILAETAQTGDFKSMFDGKSSMAPNFTSPKPYDFKSAAPEVDINGQPAQVGEELNGVFTRDYSDLMDVMDK